MKAPAADYLNAIFPKIIIKLSNLQKSQKLKTINKTLLKYSKILVINPVSDGVSPLNFVLFAYVTQSV